MVTHLNLLDVFWAWGQKSFYIHKGLWITENCIKLSNLITVSTKHNRYLQPYGERRGKCSSGERERARGGEKRKLQTMSIYNADAVYVSKEAFEECMHVCVCRCRCVSNEGFVKAHESFWEHLLWSRCYSSLLALMAVSLTKTHTQRHTAHYSLRTHTHTHAQSYTMSLVNTHLSRTHTQSYLDQCNGAS